MRLVGSPILSIVLVFFCFSCGSSFQPHPKQQFNGVSVKKPNFESYHSVLGLSDNQQTKTSERFEGSIALYNSLATTANMEQGIALSSDIKKGKFLATKFYYEKLPIYLANEKSIEQTEFFRLSTDQISEMQTAIKNRLAQTVFLHPEKTKLFCEKLIWIRAASSFFKKAQQNSSIDESAQISEPFEACENYYKENDFLNPTKDANCQKLNTAYKCFWGETGIQKTTLIAPDFSKENDMAEISNLTELVQTALSDPDASFYDELLENGVFAKDIMSSFAIFEKGLIDFSSESETTEDSLQLKALFQNSSSSWSIHDHLFYYLIHSHETNVSRKTGTDKLFQKAAIAGLFTGTSIKESDLILSEEAIAAADLKRAENKKIKSDADHLNGLNGPYMQARMKAGEELYKSSTALAALSGTYLEMISDKDQIMFTFTLTSNAPSLKACYDRHKKTTSPCDGKMYAKDTNNYHHFSWNDETGMMKIVIDDIKDPESLGLKKRLPKSIDPEDSSYQLFETNTFLGKSLVIEMYPRRFAGIVDQITGTVKLMATDKSRCFEEGSISFFKDLRFP